MSYKKKNNKETIGFGAFGTSWSNLGEEEQPLPFGEYAKENLTA